MEATRPPTEDKKICSQREFFKAFWPNLPLNSMSSSWGTYYAIGSNLTVYIILGEPVPPDDLDQLLKAAKEQVQDRATLFGPKTPVPLRRKKKNLNLTETLYDGLEYFIEPGPAYVPRRPGLEWGEFQVVTSWLYEHLSVSLKHRACSFLLFRKYVTTGEVNLAFGTIKTLEAPVSG